MFAYFVDTTIYLSFYLLAEARQNIAIRQFRLRTSQLTFEMALWPSPIRPHFLKYRSATFCSAQFHWLDMQPSRSRTACPLQPLSHLRATRRSAKRALDGWHGRWLAECRYSAQSLLLQRRRLAAIALCQARCPWLRDERRFADGCPHNAWVPRGSASVRLSMLLGAAGSGVGLGVAPHNGLTRPTRREST